MGATGRLVLTVCGSGPYRHVLSLLEREPAPWFPWGYRSSQLSSPALSVTDRGIQAELWEIDDTRAPSKARPLAVVEIDHVLRTRDYVAMTLRGTEAKPVLPEAVVLSEARRGK